MKNLSYLLFISSFILMIHSSCDYDKDATPGYIGKWVTSKPIAGTSGYVSINYSLSLTYNTFTETFLIDVGQYPKEARFVTMEGSVSVAGNMMKLIVHKLTFSKYNSTTHSASTTYETLMFTDDDFGFIYEGIGLSASNHQLEYEISDNQLNLKIDYDIDGDYSELYETIVYTRQ